MVIVLHVEHVEHVGTLRQAPRGVRRFRSVEEADAHRQRWKSAAASDAEAHEPTNDGE